MVLADAHLPYAEGRLVTVTVAYHEAEEHFSEACDALTAYQKQHFDTRFSVQPDGITVRTNAMTDPANAERMRLERVRDRCLQVRNQLLRERAELLLQMGKIR
jgi:hypothetical protein